MNPAIEVPAQDEDGFARLLERVGKSEKVGCTVDQKLELAKR
jgi:hypothetical protein